MDPNAETLFQASETVGRIRNSVAGLPEAERLAAKSVVDDPVSVVAFTPIVGTLAYIWDRQRDAVLMVHRIGRPDDEQLGKFNGLGGKLEVDESVVDGMRREIREEAALELTSFSLRGTITWSNFGPKGQDWLGFIFLVDGWEGQPPESNEEGPLEWVARQRLMQACDQQRGVRAQAKLPMWPGDRFFIPLVFDSDPRAFHGTMPYADGEPKSWNVDRL